MNVPFEKISTWRERIGQAAEFPLHVPTDVERAMVAEIADLRAELEGDDTLRARDAYHEWADKLADAIAKHFNVDIGEHSNINLPWAEALDAIEEAGAAAPADQTASVAHRSLQITLRQAQRLVEFFGGHDADMTVTERPAVWEQAEEGLYVFCTEYPEDGSEFLGATETDDDLMRLGTQQQPLAPAAGLSFHGYSDQDEHTGETILDYMRSRGEVGTDDLKVGDVLDVTAIWTQDQKWRVTCEGNPFEVERIEPAIVAAEGQVSAAAADVLAERRRQVDAEGWTAEHDDKYLHCELARASASYAVCSHPDQLSLAGARLWPFHIEWFKRSTYRRDLVKAGALLLAEIERIDRAAQSAAKPAGGDHG